MNGLLSQNAMKTDVVDNGDHFTVTADLPGFDKKDIKIGMQDGVLTVSASHEENKDEKDEKSGKYLRRERRTASYERAFRVGEDVKPEEILVKYKYVGCGRNKKRYRFFSPSAIIQTILLKLRHRTPRTSFCGLVFVHDISGDSYLLHIGIFAAIFIVLNVFVWRRREVWRPDRILSPAPAAVRLFLRERVN